MRRPTGSSRRCQTNYRTTPPGTCPSARHGPVGRMPCRHPCPCTGQSYRQKFANCHRGGKSNHALHRLIERVERIFNRLAAPFVVVPGGAYICDLYDDAIVRDRVVRRVWVLVGEQLEAASACVPGTEARRGTEGKLAYPGCEAGGGYATRYGDTVLGVRPRAECDSRCLPGWPHPE
jgi:hypothetical protein